MCAKSQSADGVRGTSAQSRIVTPEVNKSRRRSPTDVLLKSRGETPPPARRNAIAAPVVSDSCYFLISDFTASGTAKAASGTSFTDTSRMVSTILLGPTMASLRVGNLRPPKSL